MAEKAVTNRAKAQSCGKISQSKLPAGKSVSAKVEATTVTKRPTGSRDAIRGVKEEIICLNLSELYPFKNHPFGVRDDEKMQVLVESVRLLVSISIHCCGSMSAADMSSLPDTTASKPANWLVLPICSVWFTT